MKGKRNVLKITNEERRHIYLSSALSIGSAPGVVKTLVDSALAHLSIPASWTFFAGAATFGGIGLAGLGLGYYRSKQALKDAETKISEMEKNLFIILNIAADLYEELEEKYPNQKKLVLEQLKRLNNPSIGNASQNHEEKNAIDGIEPIYNKLAHLYAGLSEHTKNHFNEFNEFIKGFTIYRKQKPELTKFWNEWKKAGYANSNEITNAFVESKSIEEISTQLEKQMAEKREEIRHDMERIKVYLNHLDRATFFRQLQDQGIAKNELAFQEKLNSELSDISFFFRLNEKACCFSNDFSLNFKDYSTDKIKKRFKELAELFKDDEYPLNTEITNEFEALIDKISHLQRLEELQKQWERNKTHFNIQSSCYLYITEDAPTKDTIKNFNGPFAYVRVCKGNKLFFINKITEECILLSDQNEFHLSGKTVIEKFDEAVGNTVRYPRDPNLVRTQIKYVRLLEQDELTVISEITGHQLHLFGPQGEFRNYLITNTGSLTDYKGKSISKTELAFVGIFMSVGIYKAIDLIASSLFLLGASNVLGPVGLTAAIVCLTLALTTIGIYSYYKSQTLARNREAAHEAIGAQRNNILKPNFMQCEKSAKNKVMEVKSVPNNEVVHLPRKSILSP